MIDLHAHTTASDGSLSPSELVRQAGEAGLAALAITDHDTVAGCRPAREAATAHDGLHLITGVELSLVFRPGVLHLLGYQLNPDQPELLAALAEVQARRSRRNEEMVERLAAAGLPISLEAVRELAGDGQIGRPHMARVLVQAGAVDSVQDAFDRFLHDDAPYFVPKEKLSPEEGIALIHQAGGAAVLAHPYQTRLDDTELANQVAFWTSLGLDGIEVYYSRHTPEQVAFYQALADHHGLCRTCGSDFHGVSKPDLALGTLGPDPDGLLDPERILHELLRAAERWQ